MPRIVQSSFKDYAGAVAALGGKDRVRLRGTATTLEVRPFPEGDAVAVRYHETDIVTYHADGSVTLASGGWNTATTARKLDEYSPWSVGSTDRTWYVHAYDRASGERVDVVFADGMRLVDASAPVAAVRRFAAGADGTAAERAAREDRATRDAVNRYVRTAMANDAWAEVIDRANVDGTAGDCLFCQMTASASRDRVGGVFGEPADVGGTGHLAEHVAEGYAMVSLAFSACAERGYRPEYVVGMPDIARRAVRAYLLARLLTGPGAGRRQNVVPAPVGAGIASGSTAGRL